MVTTYQGEVSNHTPVITLFNSLEEKEGFSYTILMNSSKSVSCSFFNEQNKIKFVVGPGETKFEVWDSVDQIKNIT